jgi:hypothetical protein
LINRPPKMNVSPRHSFELEAPVSKVTPTYVEHKWSVTYCPLYGCQDLIPDPVSTATNSNHQLFISHSTSYRRTAAAGKCESPDSAKCGRGYLRCRRPLSSAKSCA